VIVPGSNLDRLHRIQAARRAAREDAAGYASLMQRALDRNVPLDARRQALAQAMARSRAAQARHAPIE
jgi:hypothetical protein